MDIRQLTYAVRLAETLHFGKAAESMYISQPAFSVQIARLEKELGFTLFERKNHRVLITEAGQHFIEKAQVILSDVASAQHEARRIQEGNSVLRVGYFGEGTAELGHRIFSEYIARSPSTEIHVVELSMVDQVTSLVSGKVDVAFLRTPIIDSRLAVKPLYREPIVAGVSLNGNLAHETSLSLLDLIDQPFAVAAAGSPKEWASFWSLDTDRGAPGRVGAAVKTVPESLASIAYCGAVDTFPVSATRVFQHEGVRFIPLIDAPMSEMSVVTLKTCTSEDSLYFVEVALDVSQSHLALLDGAVSPEASS